MFTHISADKFYLFRYIWNGNKIALRDIVFSLIIQDKDYVQTLIQLKQYIFTTK